MEWLSFGIGFVLGLVSGLTISFMVGKQKQKESKRTKRTSRLTNEIIQHYPLIRELREQGYGWRSIAKHLEEQGIKISYVHLRRLFLEIETKQKKRES